MSLGGKNSFKNSFKRIGDTGKDAINQSKKSLKDLVNLPWDKLPKKYYLFLILMFFAMFGIYVFFAFVIY